MKLKRLVALISSLAILVPSLAFAAYNDVQIIADTTTFSVAGYTINVTGSDTAVQSITVDTGTFTVTLAANSYIRVSSPTRQRFTTDTDALITERTCDSNVSTMTLTGSGVATVVVTPTSDICATVGGSGSSSTAPNTTTTSSSGGGGGGGTVAAPVVVTTPKPAVTVTPVPVVIPQTPAPIFQPVIFTFVDVKYGSSKASNDVLIVQKILNSDVSTQITSKGVGSPGHETMYFGPATKKALQKFQVKYGIAKPGQSGYGVLGPKTKDKLNDIAKQKNITK